MPGIATSLGRSINYRLGGVLQIVIFPTYMPDGQPSAQYTFTSGAISAVTYESGVELYTIDPEENTGFYSANTQIGQNRYVKHNLGFTISGYSDALGAAFKALDLNRHTAFIKTKSGKCLVLGRLNGMVAIKSEGGAGAGEDDLFGRQMELSGGEIEQPYVLTEALFNTAFTTASANAPVTG